jgi:hypothetical protein
MNKIKRNSKKIKKRSKKIKNNRLKKIRHVSRKITNARVNIGGWPSWFPKTSRVTPQPEAQIEESVEVPTTRVIKQAHEIASENDNALRESIINKIDEIAFNRSLNNPPLSDVKIKDYADDIINDFQKIMNIRANEAALYTTGMPTKDPIFCKKVLDELTALNNGSSHNKGALFEALLINFNKPLLKKINNLQKFE